MVDLRVAWSVVQRVVEKVAKTVSSLADEKVETRAAVRVQTWAG